MELRPEFRASEHPSERFFVLTGFRTVDAARST